MVRKTNQMKNRKLGMGNSEVNEWKPGIEREEEEEEVQFHGERGRTESFPVA